MHFSRGHCQAGVTILPLIDYSNYITTNELHSPNLYVTFTYTPTISAVSLSKEKIIVFKYFEFLFKYFENLDISSKKIIPQLGTLQR